MSRRNDLDEAIRLSTALYNEELNRNKRNGLVITTNVLNFNLLTDDYYKKKYTKDNEELGNMGDFIILPNNLYSKIMNFCVMYTIEFENKPVILLHKESNTYFTLRDSIDDEYAYISENYYNKIQEHLDTVMCTLHLVVDLPDSITKLILEPSNKEFLTITNQLELLENNIGVNYRILQSNMVIHVINKNIQFTVKQLFGTDSENIQLGYCVDSNIDIEFYVDENKLKSWNKEIKDEKDKQEQLARDRAERLKVLQTGFRYISKSNTLTASNNVEPTASNNVEHDLTTQDIRATRLNYFNKLK
jgi:hypothetical protein